MSEIVAAESGSNDLGDGTSILATMRRAVHDVLLDHKQAGNSVAVWDDGRVVIVPPEEILVPNPNSRVKISDPPAWRCHPLSPK